MSLIILFILFILLYDHGCRGRHVHHVGLEKQVGLELEGIQGWKIKNFLEKYPKKRIIELSLFELLQKSL